MEDINYAELYGLLPGESDFSGVIERLKDKGFPILHLSENYLKNLK